MSRLDEFMHELDRELQKIGYFTVMGRHWLEVREDEDPPLVVGAWRLDDESRAFEKGEWWGGRVPFDLKQCVQQVGEVIKYGLE